MPDPTFLANNGPTTEIKQPQSIRPRHRYKGPRESEKFNLESHQFFYDVNFLWNTTHALIDTVENDLDNVYNNTDNLPFYGMEIAWDEETPSWMSDSFQSITELIARLECIDDRLHNLTTGFIPEGGYPADDLYPSNETYPQNGQFNYVIQ